MINWNEFELKAHQPRIAVIGDLMLDHYYFCEPGGLTPEDPIAPKLRCVSESHLVGGAANVALNVASLGAHTTLLGVCGNDQPGRLILQILRPHLDVCDVALDARKTTVKKRVVVHTCHPGRKIAHPEGRYICRIDNEDTRAISSSIEEKFMQVLSSGFDMIVVSDYAKGVVTPQIIRILKGLPYIVDPKQKKISYYGGALVVTPNEAELAAAEAEDQLAQVFLVTRSGTGATLFSSSPCWSANKDALMARVGGEIGWRMEKAVSRNVPVCYREFGDPTGCGDSTIAGLAFGLACNLQLYDATLFAMACGACAVDYAGVHAVTLKEVMEELNHKEYLDED